MLNKAILLMGPTASGKTEFAISLAKRFPCDIISVDSALVYRDMDIGTAKPDAETLRRAPHQLVDIRDPEENYSAGEFVRDANAAIARSFGSGRIPLLAGGTMMYFRALTEGLAELPGADDAIRQEIDEEAGQKGWPAVHAMLAAVDPAIARRLNPNDSQRIQRALEVYRSSGKPLSEWQDHGPADAPDVEFLKIGLKVEPRSVLHRRIEDRLDSMIGSGFEEEMLKLRARPGLSRDSSSMRSVGYRQFWAYMDGDYGRDEARNRALYATRQLAKRQLTWLRSEKDVFFVDALEADAIGSISSHLAQHLG